MPIHLHNRKDLKSLRRKLRQDQSRPEILIWSKLRNNKLGYKFKRQQSIGPYIADFYCAELHLVIELDGPMHFEVERIKKDKIRENFLIKKGLKVIHFHTNSVMEDTEEVVMKIKIICDTLQKNLYLSTSPVLSSSEERNEINI